jgi:hypothetical protein
MIFSKRNKFDKKIIFNFKYKQFICIKPNGFWYSCYNSWYDWCLIKMPHWLHKYVHKININKNVVTNIENKNKLLVINTIKDFDIFNKKYRHLGFFDKINLWNNKKDESYMINWNEVSKDYDGIEICPFLLHL